MMTIAMKKKSTKSSPKGQRVPNSNPVAKNLKVNKAKVFIPKTAYNRNKMKDFE